MKKKSKVKKVKSLYGILWLPTIILVVSILALTALYLIYKKPQNLTKKAGVSKKTYIVSSEKQCQNLAVVESNKIRLPILVYHYVENVRDYKDTYRQKMNIQPDIFDTQLNSLISSGYKTVFMKEVPDIINGTSDICEPAVALTFDDGYKDFYTYVFPILKKYNAKATVYIIANFIGKEDFLNEAEITELIQSGLVEIGSHTMDHVDLSKTPSDVSRVQIIETKRGLEKRFNIIIHTFAYPFGLFKSSDVEIVREGIYSAAVTVADGALHNADQIFTLTRIRPEQFIGYDIGESLQMYPR